MSMYAELSKYAKKVADRGNRSQVNFWKIPSGESQFRILPAAKGADEGHFFMPAGCHYDIGSAKMVFCPAKTGFDATAPCPVCEAQIELAASDDPKDQRDAKQLQVRERYAFNVLVRNPGGTEEVFVLLAPPSVLTAISGIVERSDRYGNVVDIADGRDFIMSRTGAGMSTRYNVTPDGSKSRLTASKAQAMAILAEIRPLADQLTCMSYDKIYALLTGEEEVRPSAAPRSSARPPAAVSRPAAAKLATPVLGTSDDMWEEEVSEEEEDWIDGDEPETLLGAEVPEADEDGVIEEDADADEESWIDPDMPAPAAKAPDAEDPDAEVREALKRRVRSTSKGKK